MPRPCPFQGCRYNTTLAIAEGGRVRRWARLASSSSCALDVAESHPSGLSRKELSCLVGLAKETIRLIEHGAIEKLKRIPGARELLEEFASSRHEWGALEESGIDDDVKASFEDVRHLGASARQAREDAAVERWAARASELRLAGMPLLASWSMATHEEDEAMATKSKKNKGPKMSAGKSNGKAAPAAKASGDTKPINGEVMIGKPFVANHPVPIDALRRDRVSDELVEVLGKIDVVNEEKSAANGGFNLKLKELREKQHELAEAHRTSTEKQAVKCAMFLLPGNETVTRRLDTNEIVDRRTSTPEELQTEAFAGESSKKVAHKPLIEQGGE